MTQTLQLEIERPLTAQEREDVQAYVRALLARRTATADEGDRYIDVDAIRGLFADMGGDKGDKELIREAWDAETDKYTK